MPMTTIILPSRLPQQPQRYLRHSRWRWERPLRAAGPRARASVGGRRTGTRAIAIDAEAQDEHPGGFEVGAAPRPFGGGKAHRAVTSGQC